MNKVILFVTILQLFVGIVTPICKDETELTLKDDAYQFNPSSFNPFEGDYKEWWFFTATDATRGIAWCMGYSVTSPSVNSKHVSGLAGMFWPNYNENATDIQSIQDIYNYTDFSATTENATVSIGSNNHIIVIDDTTYLVVGSSLDGSLQWNLTYHQEVPGCREEMQIAMVQLDWMSFMPTAYVDGYIIHNDNKMTLSNARGYHDHNWGVWPTSDFNWVWAQYGDVSQEFAFVMGAYKIMGTEDYIGYAFLRFNGTKTKIGTLCLDSYTLTPLKFGEWEGHQYSIENHVVIKSDVYLLDFYYTTLTSGVNPGGRGLNLLVFEQVSQFNVTLSQSNGQGGFDVVVRSIGTGFNEWSDIIKL